MSLASIQKIVSIKPIEGAENIELATVLGWHVVVKKNEFQIGDLCVYIPIDTTVDPTRDCFKFLQDPKSKHPESKHSESKHSESKQVNERIVLRTKKIRGVFSQGLVVPINVLPINQDCKEGIDVADVLDVKKYEKDTSFFQSSGNLVLEPFPSHVVQKTDETNFKSAPKYREELLGKEIYVSLKMDGSSMTVIFTRKYDGEQVTFTDTFHVCSRNYTIDQGSVMYQYVDSIKLKDKMEKYGRNIAIQGEFCGPKVNGNKMQLHVYDFYVFNVKDLDTNKYLGKKKIIEIASDLNLKTVPILEEFTCTDEWTVDKFQEYSNEQLYLTSPKKVPAEGIVIRPVEPIYHPLLGKCLSFKVINQNYKD